MKNYLRVILSCVFAFFVLVLCSTLIAIIGMNDVSVFKFIGAAIAFFSGKYLNEYLKVKYPEKN